MMTETKRHRVPQGPQVEGLHNFQKDELWNGWAIEICPWESNQLVGQAETVDKQSLGQAGSAQSSRKHA